MPRPSTFITVKPSVFFWLLDKSGWSISEIANKIEYDEHEMRKWREKPENIEMPLSKIEKISKLIKRPLSAFFLPEPPKQPKMPKDFRKLPDSSQGGLSVYTKETMLAFRKAVRLQDVSRELMQNLNEFTVVDISKYSLLDDPEAIANFERKRSGLSLDLQINLANPTDMYGVWRDWLSSQGIFIFQFDIPLEDARGFVLIESEPKIIVVSKKDAIKGRIFSLIHEYSHVLLRESVICNNDSDTSSNDEVRKIENWCNHFAAAFLFPKDAAISEYKAFSPNNEIFLKFLDRLSKKYKMSSLSILVRFRFLNLIGFSDYWAAKEAIESEFFAIKQRDKEKRDALKAKGIESSFKQDSKDKTIWIDRGSDFVTLVLKSANKGFITERDVMDILDLKVNHLMKLLPS